MPPASASGQFPLKPRRRPHTHARVRTQDLRVAGKNDKQLSAVGNSRPHPRDVTLARNDASTSSSSDRETTRDGIPYTIRRSSESSISGISGSSSIGDSSCSSGGIVDRRVRPTARSSWQRAAPTAAATAAASAAVQLQRKEGRRRIAVARVFCCCCCNFPRSSSDAIRGLHISVTITIIIIIIDSVVRRRPVTFSGFPSGCR